MTATGTAIAVVDDDAAIRDSTRLLLEAHDFDVHIYQGGADFLRDDPAIECLIVDYNMPELNGLETVAEMLKRGRHVPAVIMMTAATDPSVDRAAAALGI
jgi:two-component system response regulator FixJ